MALTSGGNEPVPDATVIDAKHSIFAGELISRLKENDGILSAPRSVPKSSKKLLVRKFPLLNSPRRLNILVFTKRDMMEEILFLFPSY